MLTISEGLVLETLHTLNHCGRRARECVVMWLGPLDQRGIVDLVLHAEHESDPHGYEIDPGWMHRLWMSLSEQKRCVRAQVHTHPKQAFHSETDDAYPAVNAAGFVSIVVPHYARPPISTDEIHVSVLEASGWRRTTFLREVEVV